MKSSKKILASLGLTALVVAAAVGGTLAYFTDKDTKTNVITMGNVKGTLTEDGEITRDDGTTGKDYTNVKPGQTIVKEPTVTLSSSSEDAYVRVKVEFAFKTEDGVETEMTQEQIDALRSNLGCLNNSIWYYNAEDGYYYFKYSLEAGESESLFSTVTIPATWGNEIADKTFTIELFAEFIQADNFTPVTTDDGMITSWGTDVSIVENTK